MLRRIYKYAALTYIRTWIKSARHEHYARAHHMAICRWANPSSTVTVNVRAPSDVLVQQATDGGGKFWKRKCISCTPQKHQFVIGPSIYTIIRPTIECKNEKLWGAGRHSGLGNQWERKWCVGLVHCVYMALLQCATDVLPLPEFTAVRTTSVGSLIATASASERAPMFTVTVEDGLDYLWLD